MYQFFMKKFYILILVFLFNNIALASDDHNHGHKHKMIEASTPLPTLKVTLEKDASVFFPFKIPGHLTPNGYKLVTNVIYDTIQKYEKKF